MLVQLAGHVLDPNPISQTVRSTFGEFWRTHQVRFQCVCVCVRERMRD